jgi:tRNA pseudouridine13 synthase
LFVSKLERLIGIEVYATVSVGIGGIIRQFVDDFAVEEVLVDGSKAEINQSANVKHAVLGSSMTKERYLLCVLVKRRWDMFQALRVIAQQLDASTKQFCFAGIKDAKAVTAQHITIEGITAKDIQRVQAKDIAVRPIGYLRNKLSSYFLFGNNFHITIRAMDHPKSTIKKRIARTVQELEAIGGIPNFFGHQRFGTTRPITHQVGKALIKGNIEKAVMLFLAKPSLYEHPESRQARKQLQTARDFKQALKNFPKQLRYERLMLKHLAKKPDDHAGAFRRLPIKLRELFPQAYQSYLFNKFLSRRIAYGLPLVQAEVGDYVVNVERSGLPMLTMHKITSVESLTETNKMMKAGKMRLTIPLVGFKQHTSLGVQGDIEKQILEKEDISQESFKIPAMPEISARGELRTAMTPLNNFSVEGVSKDMVNPSRSEAKVSFTLCRGSYATILLRELMKPRNPIKAGF